MFDQTIDPIEKDMPVVRSKVVKAQAKQVLRGRNHSGMAKPSPLATSLFIGALIVTTLFLGSGTASEVARRGAWGSGLGLAVMLVIEFKEGWRQSFRADLLMLVGIYLLTLFEFLFDQPRIDQLISGESSVGATHACFIGYAGLALGRHCSLPVHRGLSRMLRLSAPPALVFYTVLFAFLGGFMYMWAAVSFDPILLVEEMMKPRFTQVWTRGQFGDWKSILFETSMLLYVVPPLTGVIFSRYKHFPAWQVGATGLMLMFLLFYGFTTGVRNVFGIYVLGFLAGYVFLLPRRERWKPLIAGIVATALLATATITMLQMRNLGLKLYLEDTNQRGRPIQDSELFVDYNLWAIGTIMDHIPSRIGYIYLEIPYVTVVRPIPRAIWSGKPDGISIDPAELAGVGGMMTMACTFIGEAYMSFGMVGVFLSALLFGALGRWWVLQTGVYRSDWSALIYSSGMFTIAITMRSSMQFTTAVLPTLFLLAFIYHFAPRLNSREREIR